MILYIELVYDGDFMCNSKYIKPYHKGYHDESGICDIGCVEKEKAIEILKNIHKNVEYNKEDLKSTIDELFNNAIKSIVRDGCACERIHGNYDGTEIIYDKYVWR